ncbi:MAG: hypothetical protein AB1505_24100 [Candidatus Latescibacterota bacterium]
MSPMSPRQRLLAASRLQRPDRLPFFHYWRHCQTGWAERECRNRGMGLCWVRPCAVERLHGVEVTERQATVAGQSVVRRLYETPVGTVTMAERRDPGTGQWHAQRSWRGITPWQVERLIKGPEDYRVARYIVEHTEYVPDSFPLEQAMDWLGEDGVVLTGLPHSPMQTLMIDWVGSEGGRFYYHHADHLDLVEELYHALVESRRPLHAIAARAPAPIALCGDNVDGVLVTPDLFARYFAPVWAEQASVLHQHGKLMAVHMDGRLKTLTKQIAATQVDIVEAFHPPPMGDLPLRAALDAWPGKSIWIGFPSAVYAMGPQAVQGYARALLAEGAPGDRLAVAMSTENQVANEELLALTEVLAAAALPLQAGRPPVAG